MLVDEADRAGLKEWVVPRLAKISDADAGVLADYVIALIVAEETEDAARQNCLDSLPDFLHNETGAFIDEVLAAVRTKSFLFKSKPKPPTPALLPSPALSTDAPPFNPPTGPSAPSKQHTNVPGLGASPPSARGEQSRKRRYYEREASQPRDSQDPHYSRAAGGERPFKQATRRGGRSGRGGGGGYDMNMGRIPGQPASMASLFNFPALPTPPPGLAPFNPADPMSFLTMMGMAFPSMPSIPSDRSQLAANQQGSHRASRTRGRKRRCRDYDTKGYCALGSACPYEHGGELVLPPAVDEYDPNQALLSIDRLQAINGRRRSNQDRSPNNSRNMALGGRGRAPFSQPGPSFDRSHTTIVVEQIPEENFSEDDVLGFFSQFGNIIDVNMQAYKRLAIVKYNDHFAARAAYDSPKVIFDNRFVKVYWYKPESVPVPPINKANSAIGGEESSEEISEQLKQDEEMLDPEEIEKRQAAAQKAFEARQKKSQEADAQIEEVERKLKEKNEQMRILREQLAKKSGSNADFGVSNGKDASGATYADLSDQLSSLQAEAQDLNADYSTYSPSSRGRGGYRGRGPFQSRGRGYAPFRGAYRGRGFAGSPFASARSGVKRWDNRPKKIAVSGVEAGSQRDEALRQYLLNNFEFESIELHPDRQDTQIITFKERYVAEMFLDQAFDIPDVGKIDLAWIPNAATLVKPEPTTSDQPTSEADMKMEDPNSDEQTVGAGHVNGVEDTNGNGNGGEADYDVADDEDRWMAA